MLEPCLLTPLIVRYPKDVKGGQVNDDLVLNLDFAPTILEYAGQKIPADMQGRSLRPLLQGQTPKDWRTTMYYRYWMHLADHGVPAHYGVRTPRYTLIHYYGQPLDMKGALKKPTEPEWELYDRQKDPNQMNNVYNDPAYADAVRDLTAELKRLRKELGDDR
jgi:arylsulfatase A-like enzyme